MWSLLCGTSKAHPRAQFRGRRAGGYERVQADLTQPDTIEAAVRKTGATRAFIYLVHGSADHMRGALEALKRGGVDFARLPPARRQRSRRSQEARAGGPRCRSLTQQVELGLGEVPGPRATSRFVLPSSTASTRWWAQGIRAGEVQVAYPESKFDFISPDDIGEVGAKLLVKGFAATEGEKDRNHVFLCGPKLRSQYGGY